jgi:hypothetical protein
LGFSFCLSLSDSFFDIELTLLLHIAERTGPPAALDGTATSRGPSQPIGIGAGTGLPRGDSVEPV